MATTLSDPPVVRPAAKRRATAARTTARQRVRQGVLLIAMLLFPVTLFYMSPYLIVYGAARGIVTGSFITFALLFVLSLFVGRLWCGWVCPGGALGEVCTAVNSASFTGGRSRSLKWVIWLPWVILIAGLFARAGGVHAINPLYMTTGGVSVANAAGYVVYYAVVGVFVVLALVAGRRAGCHTICWMAPFMILGRAVGNRLRLPGVHLAATPAACVGCDKCTTGCPMSLDVQQMVVEDRMENQDCILCGVCVDTCGKKAIRFVIARKA